MGARHRKYYSDDDRDMAWRMLWEFVGRGYASANARYSIQATFGLHTYWRLGDIVEVIYEDQQRRVKFYRKNGMQDGANGNWFEVTGINYAPDLEASAWKTTYELRQVTTHTAPPAPDPLPTIPAEVKRKA